MAERRRRHLGWLALTVGAFVAFGHAGLIGGLIVWAVYAHREPSPASLALGSGAVLGLASLAWLAAGTPELSDVYMVTRRPVPSLLAVVGVIGLGTAVWRGVEADAPARDLDAVAANAIAGVKRACRSVTVQGEVAAIVPMSALAIVVLAWVHALPTHVSGFSGSLVAAWLTDSTRFAVSGLVFAAGYLAAGEGPSRAWVRRRLEWLLVPYLLLSLIAIGLREWSSDFPPIEHPIADLLVGATFEPYYYAFVLVLLSLLAPLLMRIRGTWAGVAVGVAVSAQVGVQLWEGAEFWRARNPLLWLAFYLAGIIVWRHGKHLDRWVRVWPISLLAWSIAVTVLAVVPSDTTARRVLSLAAAWLMVGTLWLGGRTTRALPGPAWWIARNSYLLYLLHVPFVIVVAGPFGAPVWSLRAVTAGFIGLIGAISAVVVAREVLGRRSDRWLEA